MSITKINVPLLLTLASLGTAAAAGGFVISTRDKVDTHAKDIDRLKEQRATDAGDLREIKTDVKHMQRALERLEQKFGTKP